MYQRRNESYKSEIYSMLDKKSLKAEPTHPSYTQTAEKCYPDLAMYIRIGSCTTLVH